MKLLILIGSFTVGLYLGRFVVHHILHRNNKEN